VPALGSARAEATLPRGRCVILIDQRERRISCYGQGVGFCLGGWVVPLA
jgi:hypothetical protein